MAKKVLITARSFVRSVEAKAVLQKQGYELVLSQQDRPLAEEELIPLVKGVDALIAGNDAVTAAVVAAGCPTLKIIAKHGVGYNNIDVAAATKCGIPVTVTPGANSKSVADLALGLMLAIARRIPQMDKSVRAGSWGRITGCELGGKILGLVGVGNIGSEVAKRARGFDMKITAYDVCLRQDVVDNYGVTYLPLDEVVTQADFLSLHVPVLPETVGMINMDMLRKMKSSAFLINTARGELVVEDDLYNALKQGVIAGAALDAFSREPMHESPLFELSNVVVTPHAGANTYEAVTRTGIMGAEEVIRVLSGEKPRHPVAQP